MAKRAYFAATGTAQMASPSDPEIKVEDKPTLTPPASDEADRHDDSGSDLSDLEIEPEDNGEILPDHYFGNGKIPVFKPVSCCCHLCNKLNFEL